MPKQPARATNSAQSGKAQRKETAEVAMLPFTVDSGAASLPSKG